MLTVHAKPANSVIFIGIVLLTIIVYFGYAPILNSISVSTTEKGRSNNDCTGQKCLHSHEDVEKVVERCFHGKKIQSIEELVNSLQGMKVSKRQGCHSAVDYFNSIYNVRKKYTDIFVSETFHKKLAGWLNNDQSLISATKNQSLIFVDNLFSFESVVFNPVRSNRPGVKADGTLKYVNELLNSSRASCDFCDYKQKTARDGTGLMTSTHAVVVSNTFKIEKYHGMLLLKKHNLLSITQTEYLDGVALALNWFKKAHSLSPDHAYRIMYWDILPKASASQIHPHLHLTLGDFSYYAKWNRLFHASKSYQQTFGDSYFAKLVKVHIALGLTVRLGEATLIVYLTPQKDYELLVIANTASQDFFRLTYFAYSAYIIVLQQFAMSMGFVFPHVDVHDNMPMMMRIVSRGPADNPRADVSSFDLFGTPNVNTDPFKVIARIRNYIEGLKLEEYNFEGDWPL